MPETVPGDSLSTLSGLLSSYPGLLVRLTSLPSSLSSGWRLEVSEDQGGTWTSLEPARGGYTSPAVAIESGASLISSWQSSRVEASHAEISHYFSQGKLTRTRILVDDPTNPTGKSEVDGFKVTADDGSTVESTSPIDAINKAKERRGKPVEQNRGVK